VNENGFKGFLQRLFRMKSNLIERASRMRTNPDAVGAWPARVTGYSRGWYHQFANCVGSTCTFLAAVEDKGKTMNGAIYKVADIESTKKREVGYGY
jgi:hypothetical protein